MTGAFTRVGKLRQCSHLWFFDENFQLHLRIRSTKIYAWAGNFVERAEKLFDYPLKTRRGALFSRPSFQKSFLRDINSCSGTPYSTFLDLIPRWSWQFPPKSWQFSPKSNDGEHGLCPLDRATYLRARVNSTVKNVLMIARFFRK